MKQSTKFSSVAWFSLSQFIARGEREKALSIYKLLSLSINDNALTAQLEGDILASFDDKSALEKFLHSGKLYLKENRISQAIPVYEKIILLTDEIVFLDKLLSLYIQNKNKTKMEHFLENNLERLLKREGLELQKFLSTLNGINEKYHQKALWILEKNN